MKRHPRPAERRNSPRPLTPQIANLLNLAVAQYGAGQRQQMRDTCRSVLAIDTRQPDALHLLGISFLEDDPAEAEGFIRRAISCGSRDPLHYANLGRALALQDKFADAVAMYDKAIERQPGFLEAMDNRGLALSRLGRNEEAVATFGAVLAARPDNAAVLKHRGDTLSDLGRFEEAIADYDRILEISPGDPAAHERRGTALRSLERLDEAVAAFGAALAAQIDPDTLQKRGDTFLELRSFEKALADYDRILAISDGTRDTFNNRGLALMELGRPEEALADLDRALEITPDVPEILNNRGCLLKMLGRLDEALACLDKAIALSPDYTAALVNRGTLLQEQGEFEEAMKVYEEVHELWPDYAPAHWDEGLLRLVTGDLERGFAKAEWRFSVPSLNLVKPEFGKPAWRGDEPLAGRTIYVYCEQGLGDTIQFARYIPLLAKQGARVLAGVQNPLCRLVATIEGVAGCIDADRPPATVDLHSPVMSLPFAFKTTLDSVPAAVPYIPAPPLPSAWRDRLAAAKRPLVGLVWAGNVRHKNDHNRSVPFEILRPLLDCDATIVALQKDMRPGDEEAARRHGNLILAGSWFGDFYDTAAVVAALDLVITVDTSIAHLAGALARPVWILLPQIPDWRWMLHREDSPWYPTARLFRQGAERRWEPVIDRIGQELAGFLRTWAGQP